MIEQQDTRVHTEHAALDIGDDIGALVISTNAALHGQEVEVSPREDATRRTHTVVLARQVNRRAVFAALFLALPAGDYLLWCADPTVPRVVTIVGGVVAEIDWRGSTMTNVASALSPHPHAHGMAGPVPLDMLPPRYRTGKPVSSAPMGGAASLRFAADGQVAWNEMWTDFCDLALAGGAPHRGTFLAPVTPADVQVDQAAYAHVVAEIERGVGLVSGLTCAPSATPGWVSVVCTDDAMAVC